MKNKQIDEHEALLLKTSAKKARAGETWSINDSKTRGHKSTLTDVGPDEVSHIPRTHTPVTRNEKNIELRENPQKNDKRKAYILPKVQKTKPKYLGKRQKNEDIKNPVDKSIIRHLKKQDKKNK